MDFDFSDDQEQLRDAVRKYVDKGYSFERRRANEKAGGFDAKAWDELAQLGLTGLYVSDAHGGMGMGPVEGMIAMEELGRGIVLEPLSQALIAGALIGGYGDAAVQAQWLSGIACGEQLVVLAYQERKNRYQIDRCEAKAAKVQAGYELSATKNIVPSGDKATAYIVPAMLDGQLALFLVAASAPGVSSRNYNTIDGARAGDVVFDKSPAQLLATSGLVALQHGLDVGAACTCAEAVGVMDKTLAITVDYMNTRKQFGATLASFQALRHRVADVKMQLELARSMSYFASLKLNEPAPARQRAIAQAKYQVGCAIRFVSQQAVQLHGGIGVTDEYIVSHYFRKLTQMEMSFGDTMHHLGQVSDRMQDTAGVFA
jgi:alkylation response protein AidB-like acyl-CoA dehydrogenase